MDDFERAATELLRALRGERSQVGFARRLGYRANPITDWENGRRFPTIDEVLRAAELVGVETDAAFSTLAPQTPALSSCYRAHHWLSELRGSRSNVELAEQTGLSRYSVSRFLSGKSEPRLPDFLRLLDAITGRLHEWVGGLVSVEKVPTLYGRYMQIEAARRLALERPWSEAILRVLETSAYLKRKSKRSEHIAEVLGIELVEVRALLSELDSAGIIEKRRARYVATENLTVDTMSTADELLSVRQHWAQVGLSRLAEKRPDDWFAYNVIAVSEADSLKIEQRLRAAYREVRSIVSESSPAEKAAVLTMQLVRF